MTVNKAGYDGATAPHDPEVHVVGSNNDVPFAQALAEEPTKQSYQPTTTQVPPPHQHGTSNNNSHNNAQLNNLGKDGSMITCPYCHTQGVTKINRSVGCLTIIFIILLILIFWPLFWLPLCIPSCMTTNHYCQKCNRKVGTTEACS